MFADVRGLGLLNGVEFRRPTELRLRLLFDAFHRIHPAMFGQVLVMRLFRDQRIFSQICGNHFMVLKVSPALNVPDPHVGRFLDALEATVDLMHGSTRFWSEALSMAARVLHGA
jgi:ornithine--oxo-acid transaminase